MATATIMQASIEELPLRHTYRTRALNALRASGIVTIGDLCKRPFVDLSKLRTMGNKTAMEIRRALYSVGGYLKNDTAEVVNRTMLPPCQGICVKRERAQIVDVFHSHDPQCVVVMLHGGQWLKKGEWIEGPPITEQ